MNEREAMAILVSAKGIGYAQREQLLAAAGSAMDLLAEVQAHADKLGAQGMSALRRAMQGASALMDRLAEDGVKLILRGDAAYPERLAQTAKPPHLLFCRGREDLSDPLTLSVVGTRSADGYGLRHTQELCAQLARSGLCIVSGLALGVDAAAHRGALEGEGRTIAVLGGALDRFYPRENLDLARRILESGGSIVSEYAPGTDPTRYSFLERNRIVAGLGLGVLVTQAPMKSGALSTVQHALSEGREVFALPGDIDRANSQLPNRLIGEGARPVLGARDILDAIVVEPARPKKARPRRTPSGDEPKTQKAPMRALEDGERQVYDLLLSGDLDFDALCEKTGMESDEMGSLLMLLELDGIIVSLPGQRYRAR